MESFRTKNFLQKRNSLLYEKGSLRFEPRLEEGVRGNIYTVYLRLIRKVLEDTLG